MDYADLTIDQQLALVRTEVANSARFQTLIDQWTAVRGEFGKAEASLQTEAGGLANQWSDKGGLALQAGVAESLKSLKPWVNATDIAQVLVPLRQQIIDTEKRIAALVAERAALEALEKNQQPGVPSSAAGVLLYALYRKGAIQREGGEAMNALAQSFREGSSSMQKSTPTTAWHGPDGAGKTSALSAAGNQTGAGGRTGAVGGGSATGSAGQGGAVGEDALAASSVPGGVPGTAGTSQGAGAQTMPGVPGSGAADNGNPALDGAPAPAPPVPTVPGGPAVPAPTPNGPVHPPPWTGIPPTPRPPRIPTPPTPPWMPRSIPDPIRPGSIPPLGTLGGRASGGAGKFQLPAFGGGAGGGVGGGLPRISTGTGAIEGSAGSPPQGRGNVRGGFDAEGMAPGSVRGATTSPANAGASPGSGMPPMAPPMAPGQGGEGQKAGRTERAQQIRRPPARFPGVPATLRGRADGSETGEFGSVAAASQATRRRWREDPETTMQLLDEELWDVAEYPQRPRPTAV